VTTIRAFDVAHDTQAVLAVWRASSRVGHPFFDEAELDRQQHLVATRYLPVAETWLATGEGGAGVSGFVSLLGSVVGGLFVAPDRHGCGIGRQLIEHSRGLKGPLQVEVYAENPIAPAFYRRCGFRETARRPVDDEGRPLALIVMELG
jgi:ribosomal protein S18 acetylase RimI-like enzyme